MKYFIANWKAHKNQKEVGTWLNTFIKVVKNSPNIKSNLNNNKIQIVICPAFPFFFSLKEKIKEFNNIFIGSQDISKFDEGEYTGEVDGKMLQDYVDYVIIGHSERRKLLNENNEILFQKVKHAKKYDIKPIFCIRGEQDPIPKEVKIIAYEPVSAIGTGDNETLPNVLQIKQRLKISPDIKFLYGGSIDKNNALNYLKSDEIDGFLIGTASLNPISFAEIITKY